VIGAGLDRLVPVHHAEDLHKRLPTSELLRFDQSGHGVIAEHAVAVAEAVRRLVVRADAGNDCGTQHVLR
jgi:pimeloyl-ACP methyl ester carboxylesterase